MGEGLIQGHCGGKQSLLTHAAILISAECHIIVKEDGGWVHPGNNRHHRFFKPTDRTEFSDSVSLDISLRFLLPSQDFSGKVLEVTAKEEEFASFQVEKQFDWTQLKTIVLFNGVSYLTLLVYTRSSLWLPHSHSHRGWQRVVSEKACLLGGNKLCSPVGCRGMCQPHWALSYPTIHLSVQQIDNLCFGPRLFQVPCSPWSLGQRFPVMESEHQYLSPEQITQGAQREGLKDLFSHLCNIP